MNGTCYHRCGYFLSAFMYTFHSNFLRYILYIFRVHGLCQFVVMLIFGMLLMMMFNNARADQNFIIQTYHAPIAGFLSNSHLILGDSEAMLIDAQFSEDEGKNVIKMIEASGKRLSKIVITHAHPDHYYGLESLGQKYNTIVITGNSRTIKEVDKSVSHWAKDGLTKRKFSNTKVLQDNQLTLDDEVLTYLVLENGESPANTVIYMPSIKALFIGDLASNGVHMWLAEGNSTRWLSHLEQVRQLGPIETIYPGHGILGDASLIDNAVKYIKDFQKTIAESPNAETAIATMSALYPHYQMPDILIGSIMSAMAVRNNK